MSKKEEIQKILDELTNVITKGSDFEFEAEYERLKMIQEQYIKELNPQKEEDRKILKYVFEKNKELINIIDKKQKLILEQVNGMSTNKENKKNYDLYK